NALGNLRDRPLILFGWCKISSHYPDEIGQILKPLSYESPISAKIRFAARLHLSEPALIAAIVSEIGREQPNDDASVICLPEHVVGKIEICRIGCGEVARLLERKDFGASGRRIGAKLMLDQVHNQRIKSTLCPVIQVLINFLVPQLSNERP